MCEECINRDTPEQKIAKVKYHEWLAKHLQLGVDWRHRYNRATREAERLRILSPSSFATYIPDGQIIGEEVPL